MNGASSDDVVLIQKMVTPNMGRLEHGYSEQGYRNLDTLEQGYYEVTWNPVTPI